MTFKLKLKFENNNYFNFMHFNMYITLNKLIYKNNIKKPKHKFIVVECIRIGTKCNAINNLDMKTTQMFIFFIKITSQNTSTA